MQINVYMAVTADEYELPLFVSDTPEEMAKFVKCKYHDIFAKIRRQSATRDGMRIRRVEIDVLTKEMA